MKSKWAINRLLKKLSSLFIFRILLRVCCLIYFLTNLVNPGNAQVLKGFTATEKFNEQEITLKDHWKNVTVNINVPLQLNPAGKTYLIFYALPNGNSIEWTKGKKTLPGDDWHFDIQHIAAQTRFIRNTDHRNNYIIAYLMADQKSWPAWKRNTPDSIYLVKNIVDSISTIFKTFNPAIILSSHSGGGSFLFGFIDAVKDIPNNIERIVFLDSDYGYVDSMHKTKLVNWLRAGNKNKLVVLAYNDSVVIFNGKPLVSATGGTWYRSRLMQRDLSTAFNFTSTMDTAFIVHKALQQRITMLLKENPNGLIYHTEQVARNGFILSVFTATKFDHKKYFTYFGERVYEKFISD